MKLCPRHRLLAYLLRPLAGPGGAPPQPDTYVALVRDTATGVEGRVRHNVLRHARVWCTCLAVGHAHAAGAGHSAVLGA